MSPEPRVTWLLPVRNGLPHLEGTLASIEIQSFRSWEVLAWDNGSTDGSADLLRAWIPSRLPGRAVTGRPFVLLGECLRTMVAEARTELIARIDADDVNEPERLTEQVSHLDRDPGLLAVGSWMRQIDAAGREGRPMRHPAVEPAEIRWMLPFYNPLFHPTMCLRRRAVLEAGNYSAMGMGQDWDLWFRLVQRGQIAVLPDPLVRYRVHPTSVSSQERSRWPDLCRRLLERHAPDLFPDVPPERVMAVWQFFSINSPTRRHRPPPRQWVIDMATATAKQGGWPEQELLKLRVVREMIDRCPPERPAEVLPHLALRLRMALRKLAGGRPTVRDTG